MFVVHHSPFFDFHFPSDVFTPCKKLSSVWFMLFSFAEFLTSPAEKSYHAFIPKHFQKNGSKRSQEPRPHSALLFVRRKIPLTGFFSSEKIDYRCILCKYEVFKMCKYSLYILTCPLVAIEDDGVAVYCETIL